MFDISLSIPQLKGNELKYIKECIDTEWVSSAGKYVNLFENKICEFTGSEFAIACVNGTSALQVALEIAGVSSGDEVIVPTLTFIAPINAIKYIDASPIFMDADDFFNIDIEKTIDFIKNKTKFKNGVSLNKDTNKRITAVLPVHVWGNACNLDQLINICDERNIAIVEDATESLGTIYTRGRLAGKHTGTIGKLGCLSFNGNKIITSGGGGMILTNQKDLADKARYITTQAKDDPVKYIHNEIGYNYRLTNIQAALGVAQLEQLSKFLSQKEKINKFYKEKVKKLDGYKIAPSPDYAKNNSWLNILRISEKKSSSVEFLMNKFTKNGIETRPVWYLNHLQKPYKKYFDYLIDKAIHLHASSLCLPSSVNLNEQDCSRVISILNE